MPIGSDPRPGSELAGFRLEALLGRGGMGAVYRAEDLRLGRKVALKLLAPELAENDRFRERFLRESQLAASLDHPNIVPIYAAGETDGQLYLAMRYVEGYDLRQLLAREGRLEPGRALALLEQVADALDAAHERGLIHRDVKPGNVLIAERAGREHCYLADFGLTKQTASISGLTGTGELVGTVAYVSPEQIRGETVDGRADVYALGCVLYECLAGESPFARETEVATLWAHVNDAPPALSTSRPELGREVDGVLTRALAKAPAERPATCSELVASARSALRLVGPAAPTRPRRRRTRALPRLRRRSALLLAAAAVLLAVAVLTAVFLRDDPAPVVVPPNSVAIVHPESNRVVDTIPLGNGKRPGPIAFGAGAIWVGNLDDQTVTRIDADSRTVVTTIPLNDSTPTGLVEGFGHVWVAHGLLGDLQRIDTQFNELTPPPIDVAATAFGSANGSVARGFGSIWAVFGDSTLARIEPATGRVVESARAGTNPAGIAVGSGFFWVTNSGDARVGRYNPATFAEGPIDTISVGRRPFGIAHGAGAIWVANSAGNTVTRIDPNSGAVEATIEVGENPTAVAADDDAVWVAHPSEGILTRIDPETNKGEDTIDVGNAPAGLVLADGFLWVTVQAP
jgi:YVTN family beta-propeller protein